MFTEDQLKALRRTMRGWYPYKGHRIVAPRQHDYHFTWQPEPFFAAITSDGIVPHPDIANPKSKVFLAAEMSRTAFQRHVKFYAGKEYFSAAYETLQFTDHSVYLLAEEDDPDIYCMATPMGVVMLIGKLLRSDRPYKRCARAFGKLRNFNR